MLVGVCVCADVACCTDWWYGCVIWFKIINYKMTKINTFRHLSVDKPFFLNACGCYVAWCADCSIVFDCTLACVFCMFAVFANDSGERSESRGGRNT